MCDKKIEKIVKATLEKKGLLNYTIDVHGTTSKEDGFIGSIYFVTVTGKTKNGINKTFNFALKLPKDNNKLKKQMPVREFFEKEIYIYNKVQKVFDKFQKNQNIENCLDFFPHCYACDDSENNEFLVLENLKAQGYILCDKANELHHDYIKLIFQAYGKLHAFSLALRNKEPKIFENLVIENNINMFSYYLFKSNLIDFIFEWFEEAKSNICIKDEEIIQKVQFTKKDVKYILGDLLLEDSMHRVVTHGDGWINNFLFKLDEATKKPLHVGIIDWQSSGLASPVIDLSFFAYVCCDLEKYKDVRELLKIYYGSLSDCLCKLGCNPEEVFSYDTLIKHWKKYSCYGLVLSSFALKFTLSEGDEVPDFAAAAEQGKGFLENFNFSIKINRHVYNKKLRDNFVHYVNNISEL